MVKKKRRVSVGKEKKTRVREGSRVVEKAGSVIGKIYLFSFLSFLK